MDRVKAENAANAERQRFAEQERSNLGKRVFKRAMPNWIRIKFLEQPVKSTVNDLCTLANRLLFSNSMCPADDITRDGLM